MVSFSFGFNLTYAASKDPHRDRNQRRRGRVSALKALDWTGVREQYDTRQRVRLELTKLRNEGKRVPFVELLLGVSDPAGNYSAAEHSLGPKILALNPNAVSRVSQLVDRFEAAKSGHEVPAVIRSAGHQYLRIGVGSEASCMINPDTCWVANARTIWTHLVIKHADNFQKAAEELKLYRDSDATSEMEYAKWTHIHGELAATMTRVAEDGAKLAKAAKSKTRIGHIPLGRRDRQPVVRGLLRRMNGIERYVLAGGSRPRGYGSGHLRNREAPPNDDAAATGRISGRSTFRRRVGPKSSWTFITRAATCAGARRLRRRRRPTVEHPQTQAPRDLLASTPARVFSRPMPFLQRNAILGHARYKRIGTGDDDCSR
jgi:hypothetical protein